MSILEQEFLDGTETVITGLKKSFEDKDFVLVLVIDLIEELARDNIIHLRKARNIDVLGAEVRKYTLDAQKDVLALFSGTRSGRYFAFLPNVTVRVHSSLESTARMISLPTSSRG
jgi:hypothetical protein